MRGCLRLYFSDLVLKRVWVDFGLRFENMFGDRKRDLELDSCVCGVGRKGYFVFYRL